MLTQEILKSIFSYCPKTGLFTRKINNKIKKIGHIYHQKDENKYLAMDVLGVRNNAHRLAWLYMTGSMPQGKIDHINCKKNDNRWHNLRLVSHKENLENRITPYKNNKSGYLGVSWSKTMNKYEACIRQNYKTIHIGFFENPVDAHNAYIKVKRELHTGCTL